MNLKIDHQRFSRVNSRKKKEFRKNEQSLRDLWDRVKNINMHIMGVPERETKERRGKENI